MDQDDRDSIQALIDDLKAQLAQKTQQLADATNTLSTSCDGRLTSLESGSTGASATISNLQTTVGQHTTSINSANSTIATLQSTITSLQSALTTAQNTITANNATIAANNATIKRLSLSASRMGSYIPLYSWNANGYLTVIALKQKYPDVPIVAAINPSSGPGASKTTVIDTAVKAMQAAGVIVIGYVGTNYGSELTKAQYPVGNSFPSNTPRDLASIKANCDAYVNWYAVDGFMFDDYSERQNITLPDGSTKDVYNTFYLPLFQYVRTLPGIKYIKGNMGTKPAYLPLADLCDNVCVLERNVQSSGVPPLSLIQTNTLNGQLRGKATVVLYNATTQDLANLTTCAQYAKFFYCSDSGYAAPPSYYDATITTLAGL